MKRTLALLLALGAVAFLLSACGSDSEDAGDDTTATSSADGPSAGSIEINATEFAFDPDAIEVTADEDFTIALVNGGAVEHDFTIEGQEDRKVAVTPGETAEGTFQVPAGEITFFCSVPGHREAGMEGTLTAAA
ncbi:MAG: cupredoxin domain-containing protein [Acidimicrobiales bacterium]|nr:cupredoxin domain-containing protein [Acidimicrobiales bacterium]